MQKRKLSTVTLIGVDCLAIKRLSLAAKICQERFAFAEVKLLTSLPARGEKHIVRIPPIRSEAAYSRFTLEKLNKYIKTPHALIIQYDGFILNPKAWTDEFLKYDYIGAPWLVADWSVKDFGFPKNLLGKLVVGNGGFSLRSKKCLSFLKSCHIRGDLIFIRKMSLFVSAIGNIWNDEEFDLRRSSLRSNSVLN